MTRRRALTVLAAIAAALPAGAAAAPWSAPQDVSGPGFAEAIVTAAYDVTGRGLLVWMAPTDPRYRSATRPPGADAWRPGPSLPGGLAHLRSRPAIALYGRSRTVLVGARRGGFGPTLRYRMVTAFGHTGGRFGPLTTLDVGARGAPRAPRSLSSPALAVDAAGNGLAAWSRDDRGTTAIRVVERGPGGPWRPARTMAEGASRPAVAIDADYGRVVAWYRHGRVEVRTRPVHGSWGRAVTVARTAHPPAALRAAIDRGGRILLAWSTIHQPAAQNASFAFEAAVRTGAGAWRHQVLDRFRAGGFAFAGAQDRLYAVVTATGRAAVAWHGAANGRAAVKVARLRDGRRLTTPEVVTGPAEPARPTDLVAARGGALVVVWERELAGAVARSQVRTAVAPAGRPFGPPEALPATCLGPICLPFGGRVAVDGVTGRLTAAWIERDAANYRVWSSTRALP